MSEQDPNQKPNPPQDENIQGSDDAQSAEAQMQHDEEVVTDELAVIRTELEDTQQRLLRVSADYQNYIRRSHGNIESARQEQLADVAKSLLVVLDHFDRALEVDPAKTDTAGLLKGVQIVRDELVNALERFAIRQQKIKPGDEFVPGSHEAVMQQEVPDMEPGKVAAVLQAGYELGERTLRPAKVSVSK